MTVGAAKTRFVIAVFDQGEGLYRALVELFRRGIVREQVGVVALARTLQNLWRPAMQMNAEDAHTNAIVDDVEAATCLCSMCDNRPVVAVTRNSLWQCLKTFTAEPDAVEPDDGIISARWMSPDLRGDLTTYIRSGSVVLGVSAKSIDQQRQCTRVLLEHSSHRVQTHEFTFDQYARFYTVSPARHTPATRDE